MKFPVDIDLFIRAGEIEYGYKAGNAQRELIELILEKANGAYAQAYGGEVTTNLYRRYTKQDLDKYEAQCGAVADREFVLKMVNLGRLLCREAAAQGKEDRSAKR